MAEIIERKLAGPDDPIYQEPFSAIFLRRNRMPTDAASEGNSPAPSSDTARDNTGETNHESGEELHSA